MLIKGRKLLILSSLIFIILVGPKKSLATFGEDAAAMIPFLTEIIKESIYQQRQLQFIYENSKKHREIIESINIGIEDTINVLDSLPIKDDQILEGLDSFKKSLNHVQDLYGNISSINGEEFLKLHDDTVAESFKVSNSIKKYAEIQEKNSENLSKSAEISSPKGALRTNVKTNAAILHTLNQVLRVNGQMLKLQSEVLALNTKRAKDSHRSYKKANKDFSKALKHFHGDFKTPRFK